MDYLTDMVVSGIAYITTVLLVALGLIIALALSNLVSVIPVVGGIDKTGGDCVWICPVNTHRMGADACNHAFFCV